MYLEIRKEKIKMKNKTKYLIFIIIGQLIGLGFAIGFGNGLFTVIY